MPPRMITRSALSFAAVGLLLFLPAGTLDWPQAWSFLVLFTVCSLATGFWLQRVDPALLAARMESPFAAEQKLRDRAVMVAILAGFAVWLAFMGLDARRFGWSHTPVWAQVLGAAAIVAAFYGWTGVLRANRFAATTIRVQRERNQTVISSGPYAVVRHPMYAYAVLLMIGTPLLLGSLWSLLGLAVLVPLLIARTLGEEAMLMDGLPGYRAYASKVRFRLFPGVW